MDLRSITRQQALIAAGILVVSVLSIISFAVSPHVPEYGAQGQEAQAQFDAKLFQDREAYNEYLQKLNLNPEASRLLLQETFNEEDVRKVVEDELEVNQPIQIPTIADTEIRIAGASTDASMQAYVDRVTALNDQLTQAAADRAWEMYEGDPYDLGTLQAQVDRHNALVAEVPVPADAAALHKSYLNIYRSMSRQTEFAENYVNSSPKPKFASWYPEAAVFVDQRNQLETEMLRLDQKYAISWPERESQNLAWTDEALVSLGLAKRADAVFGFGDFLVELAKDAVGAALSATFNGLLGKLIGKFEENFIISNFLQYSDALVASRYSDDYLNKYVTDEVDKLMIKRFIPQFNCGQTDVVEIRKLANLRAREFLGFDPTALDPTDPNFEKNLLKLGTGLAFEDGQMNVSRARASLTEYKATYSAFAEIWSPGKKSAVAEPPKVSVPNVKLAPPVNTGVPGGTAPAGAIGSNVGPAPAPPGTLPSGNAGNVSLAPTPNTGVPGGTAPAGAIGSNVGPAPDPAKQGTTTSYKIAVSANLVVGTQAGALVASFLSGAPNWRSLTGFIGPIVQRLVTALVNEFIFKQATFTIKEQDRSLCLKGASSFGNLLPADIPEEGLKTPTLTPEDIANCEQFPSACAIDGIYTPPKPVTPQPTVFHRAFPSLLHTLS